MCYGYIDKVKSTRIALDVSKEGIIVSVGHHRSSFDFEVWVRSLLLLCFMFAEVWAQGPVHSSQVLSLWSYSTASILLILNPCQSCTRPHSKGFSASLISFGFCLGTVIFLIHRLISFLSFLKNLQTIFVMAV